MRDSGKFCRPKAKRHPLTGDLIVLLNCGNTVVVDQKDYKKMNYKFKITSFYGRSSDDIGAIKVMNTDLGIITYVYPSEYTLLKGDFEILDIVGDKREDPFNGYEYIDLGLPSGTLWATMNVGASSETDYGNYYQYGKGAAQYAATSGDSNYSGTEDPLDSSVDTAVQVWGGSWHMPTRAQMEELTANTTYQWVTNYKGSGINGGTFTATNGAVLFFPATGGWYSGSQGSVGNLGYYWGSSPDGSDDACNLYFGDGIEGVDSNGRASGYSVRPVITPEVDSRPIAQIGDVKVHNSILNIDAIFSVLDFINLEDSSWEATDIIGTISKDDAKVGDIAIKIKNVIGFINKDDWDDVKDYYEAVGIVAIEKGIIDDRVRLVSLDYMDFNSPTTGSDSGQNMVWGADGNISGLANRTQVPCMSNSTDKVLTSDVQRATSNGYIPTDYFTGPVSANSKYKYQTNFSDGTFCPVPYLADGSLNPQFIATSGTIPGTSTTFSISNVFADFDGEGNTLKIMSKCTVTTPTNTNSTGNYPSAQCCSLYNKGNLNWYLPSGGELALTICNMNSLGISRLKIKNVNYSLNNYWYWSSTPHSSLHARRFRCSNGGLYWDGNNNSGRVLAVAAF